MRDYLRVSFDKSGRQRSPDEQQVELDRDAEHEGFDCVGPPYLDIGSASKFAEKERRYFADLLSDLADGQFGAEILGLWETSRGARKMGDSVVLYDLLAEQGILVWVHTHHRLYDPRIARDRESLLTDAARDERASSETSERILRNVASQAEAGAPHGLCPFGYKREYDEKSGAFVRQVKDPDTAPIVEEVFLRTAAGEAMHTIAKDLAERGIEKPSGGPFSDQHLRIWLRNPAYTGLRVRAPRRRGKRSAAAVADGTLTEGSWPKIVSRKDWVAVKALLADPKRKKYRAGGARHLLSGTAVCDVCDAVLRAANVGGGKRMYSCSATGCVAVHEAELDRFARDVVKAFLSDKNEYRVLLQEDEQRGAELETAQKKLADVQAEIVDLKAKVDAEALTLDFAASVEPGMRRREKRLQAEVDRLEVPPELAGLFTPGEDVGARWDRSTVAQNRQLARAILMPRFAGQLRVRRVSVRGAREPVEDRTAVVRHRE